MDEEVRRRLAYEAQRRQQRGESQRSISRVLGIHRNTVRKLLEELAARRDGDFRTAGQEHRGPRGEGNPPPPRRWRPLLYRKALRLAVTAGQREPPWEIR